MEKVKGGELVEEQSLAFLRAGLDDLLRDIRHKDTVIRQIS